MSEVRRLYVDIRISIVAILILSTAFTCNNEPSSTRSRRRKIKLRSPFREMIQPGRRYAPPDHSHQSPSTNPELLQKLKVIPYPYQVRTQIWTYNFYL